MCFPFFDLLFFCFGVVQPLRTPHTDDMRQMLDDLASASEARR